jgi:hypothetical protein
LSLYRVACEAGQKEIADFFLQMINVGMGARAVVPVQSEDERSMIQALQSILYDARFSHLRKPLAKLLAPVQAHLQEMAAFERVEAADIPAVAHQMIKRQQEQAEKEKRKK